MSRRGNYRLDRKQPKKERKSLNKRSISVVSCKNSSKDLWRNVMRKKSLFFVLPIVFSMAVPPAFAADPIEEFVFQGVLKDSTGGLIT